MARFNFESLNKVRVFDIDTSDFEYTNLEDLYKENGADAIYPLTAVYIGNKSYYDPETPIVATDKCYVNIPVHQLPEIKAMLDSKAAIKDINEGMVGFKIEQYYQKRFKRNCYVARWCDMPIE